MKSEDKGYFPYLFNKTSNYDVELDHLPDISNYCMESKKPDEYRKFLEWLVALLIDLGKLFRYTQNYNTPFELKRELIEYGDNDTAPLLI